MLLYMLSFLGLVPTFQATKCKRLLNITMERIKLLRSRREAQLRHLRMDVVQLLKLQKEQKAQVWLGRIWKETCLLLVYSKIADYCQSVQSNLKDIAGQRECPSNLEEPLASLCFAASRCADLPELQKLREIFAMKYGRDFVISAEELHEDCHVNQEFLDYLCATDPSDALKMELLEEIAAQVNKQDNKQQELHDSSSTEVSVDANDYPQEEIDTLEDSEVKDDKDEMGDGNLQEMDVVQEMDNRTATVCEEDLGSTELANCKQTVQGRQTRRSKFKIRVFRRKLLWQNKDTEEKGNAKVHACVEEEGKDEENAHMNEPEEPNEEQHLVLLSDEEPSYSRPPQRPPPPPPPPKRAPPQPSTL